VKKRPHVRPIAVEVKRYKFGTIPIPKPGDVVKKTMDQLIVKGAREHNLKDIFLEIPKGKLVIFTGVSGSGKSSLAFDTIYAEGQRRYVESLSAYARQFLGQMEKPHYDWIRGLSPTISIEQKAAAKNPRSTVGTVTEIYDYLRVLYARVGRQHCPTCSKPVGKQSAEQMVRFIKSWPSGTKILLLAPKITNRKGEYREVFMDAERLGFSRVRVNGQVRTLDEKIELDKKLKHNIEIVVDRLVVKDSISNRLTDSVELALQLGEGNMLVHLVEEDKDVVFSERLACTSCHLSFSELSPQTFSFNSPLGMCIHCNGLGTTITVDENTFVENPDLSISKGAILPWASAMKRKKGWTYRVIRSILEQLEIDPNIPFHQLSEVQKNYIFFGSAEKNEAKLGSDTPRFSRHHFKGLVNSYLLRIQESAGESVQLRESHSKHVRNITCPKCEGTRLKAESRSVLINEHSVPSLCSQTIRQAAHSMDNLALDGNDLKIAGEILKEIRSRLGFLCSVGLEYLTLNRLAPTLSGGESQRIRLASQIGSELTGVLYILDEPSIGLHQRDNHRLIQTLQHLRDIGNSVLVVEHDTDTIRSADHVVDFGPGAGKLGGEIVFSGPYNKLLEHPTSLTARYLTGKLKILPDRKKLVPRGEFLEILGASENNLKEVDARIPVGCFVAVTGVSGAGKSSLVNSILWPAAQKKFFRSSVLVGEHAEMKGWEYFDSVIDINQQPIGRTPRSNPATYVKLFDHIRNLFSGLEESRIYGYKPGRFSFNVKGGRCESCQGAGVIRVEMHFLADVFVTCESCKGKRFNEATLRIRFKGKNVSEILDMTIDEAVELFDGIPTIRRILRTLQDVGLGYIHLGQPATTLSGGEAQRVKLSRELARRSTGKTLYLLDEPTTGLHFDDIHKLLKVLSRLVDQGNTVVVIEHNLDVIRCADYLIDLGPEGGNGGGEIVYQGPVEGILSEPRSHTGQFLKPYLENDSRGEEGDHYYVEETG
jgi:excinuclease ABC subunit A